MFESSDTMDNMSL